MNTIVTGGPRLLCDANSLQSETNSTLEEDAFTESDSYRSKELQRKANRQSIVEMDEQIFRQPSTISTGAVAKQS